MKTYAIRSEVTTRGEWFLPSDENRRIPGTFSWSENGADLDLHDSFIELQPGPLFPMQSYPVICGVTTDSALVSLLETSLSRSQFSFGQAGVRTPVAFSSNLVVVGDHVNKESTYTEIRARIPGLEIWLGMGGFEQRLVPKTKDSPASVIYSVNAMEEDRVQILESKTTLGWNVDRHSSGNPQSKFSITSSGHLRIVPDQPQDLDWFLRELGKVTTLLAFIAGSVMTADEIIAKVAESAVDVNVLVTWHDAQYCAYRDPHEFFLLCGNMGVDFSAVLQAWYSHFETVATPSQLALSVLASKGMWTNFQFLSLMQALEGFHRATSGGMYMSPIDYEEVRHTLTTAIPTSVSPSHRDALKSRIKYGNEVSLRKRLDELASQLNVDVRKRIFNKDGSVPTKWIETRNYYTHWDAASRGEAMDVPEMYYATVRMRHFLRALYLVHVGIPQDVIAKALDGANKESQHLLQINHPTPATD